MTTIEQFRTDIISIFDNDIDWNLTLTHIIPDENYDENDNQFYQLFSGNNKPIQITNDERITLENEIDYISGGIHKIYINNHLNSDMISDGYTYKGHLIIGGNNKNKGYVIIYKYKFLNNFIDYSPLFKIDYE